MIGVQELLDMEHGIKVANGIVRQLDKNVRMTRAKFIGSLHTELPLDLENQAEGRVVEWEKASCNGGFTLERNDFRSPKAHYYDENENAAAEARLERFEKLCPKRESVRSDGKQRYTVPYMITMSEFGEIQSLDEAHIEEVNALAETAGDGGRQALRNVLCAELPNVSRHMVNSIIKCVEEADSDFGIKLTDLHRLMGVDDAQIPAVWAALQKHLPIVVEGTKELPLMEGLGVPYLTKSPTRNEFISRLGSQPFIGKRRALFLVTELENAQLRGGLVERDLVRLELGDAQKDVMKVLMNSCPRRSSGGLATPYKLRLERDGSVVYSRW